MALAGCRIGIVYIILFGIIAKYNQKSVTVITESGQRWTVAPTFLRKSELTSKAASKGGKVINLPKK
jgi:hypothetical protein